MLKPLSAAFVFVIILFLAPFILWIGLFFALGTPGTPTQDYWIPEKPPAIYLKKQPDLVFSTISSEDFLSYFSQTLNFSLKPSTEYKTQGEYPDYNLKYYIGFTQPNPHIKLWAHTMTTLSSPSHVVEGFFHTETNSKTNEISREVDEITINYLSTSANLFFEEQYHQEINSWIKDNLEAFSENKPANYFQSITINGIEVGLFQNSFKYMNNGNTIFMWWRNLKIKKISD